MAVLTVSVPDGTSDATIISLGFGVLLGLLAMAVIHRRLRVPPPRGYCHKCGYNLTGNVSGRCPECGEPVSGDGRG